MRDPIGSFFLMMAQFYLSAFVFTLFSLVFPGADAQTSAVERTKQNNQQSNSRQAKGTADAIANAQFRAKQFSSLIGTTQQKRPSGSPVSATLNLPTSSFNPEMSYFHPQRTTRAVQAPKLSSSVINTSGGLTGVIAQSASASSQVNYTKLLLKSGFTALA